MTLKDFITKPELLVIYKNKIQVELVNKTLVPCIFYFSLYENRFRKRWITITNDWERESSIKLYRYHIIYYEKLLLWTKGINFSDIPTYKTIRSSRVFNKLADQPELQIKEMP